MKVFVNLITLFRILATFILPFIWHILSHYQIILFVAFVLITDLFDGFLARTFHVQTLFGSLLDQMADKMFGIILLLILANYFKKYYLIASFEIIIAIICIISGFKGVSTNSSYIGRLKMWVIGLTIVIGMSYIFKNSLLNINVFSNIIKNIDINTLNIMMIVSSIFEIIVIITYLMHLLKELKNNHEKIIIRFKNEEDLNYVLFNTDYYLKHRNKPLSKLLLK